MSGLAGGGARCEANSSVFSAARSLVARAQQGERMRRIGVLVALPEAEANMKARLAALRQGLERRGWSDGRNIRIDFRHAPAGNRVQALAQESCKSKAMGKGGKATPLAPSVSNPRCEHAFSRGFDQRKLGSIPQTMKRIIQATLLIDAIIALYNYI